MTETFYLITNVSGQTYWSYIGDVFNTLGYHLAAVKKYGRIYINRNGGWFPSSAVKTIHKTVKQKDFPPE